MQKWFLLVRRCLLILFFLPVLAAGAQVVSGLSPQALAEQHAPPGGGSWGSASQEDFGANKGQLELDRELNGRPGFPPIIHLPVFPNQQLQLRVTPNPVPVGEQCTVQAILEPAVDAISIQYDFFLNGQRLSTSNTANWIRFRPRDAGSYEVEAQAFIRSDPVRTVRSNPVRLSVLPPEIPPERPPKPTLSIDPVHQVIRQGDPAYFQVHSSRPIQFVWDGGGQEGEGHTSSANVFRVETENLSPGRYSIHVKGLIRTFALISTTAELVIEPARVPVVISIEPQRQIVYQGQTATFTGSVSLDGEHGQLSWQGPAGQAGFGNQFTVDSSMLRPGQYSIEAFVQRGRDNPPSSVAWLEVRAVAPPSLTPPSHPPQPLPSPNGPPPILFWLIPLMLAGPLLLYLLVKPHPSQVVADPPVGFEVRVVQGEHSFQQVSRSKRQDDSQVVLVFNRGRQYFIDTTSSGE